MLNALQINKKTMPYQPFNRQNFEESGKMLAVSVSELTRV